LGWKPIKKLDEYVNDFVNNQKWPTIYY
jgi:hypothetical protein